MPSIFVAVPYSRPHYGGFVESLLLTEMPEQVVFKQVWGMALDVARNYLVDCFLQDRSKPDYMLWLDNDASFPAGAIMRLIEHNLPMVCGCMYTTTIPPKPTMGQYLGKNSDGKHYYKFAEVVRQIVTLARDELSEIPKQNAIMFDQAKLMEVDGCGLHFTLVRRDVLELIHPPYFASLDYQNNGGEDFFFCRQVKESGFPIYTDLSIHTGHIVGEREGADFGIRELLTVAKSSRIEDLIDVDGDNWIT